MKAIVMAGGEGTRLRPLTVKRPKPMVRLMDRPVLEYILRLLKKHGVSDVCITLGYMADSVENYLRGAQPGMNIECRTEREPLGTAGGVKACADFIGEDDCLVISGDAMCDFDLSACFEFHRKKNSEATVVLCGSDAPLEYGLVVCGSGGRIERFVEKPPWEAVCTDCINTGVYILSPEILSEIPDGKYDFGRDLFPKLLSEGRRLFGVRAEGYWCDIGSPEAYLGCACDMLEGKMKFSCAAPETERGVWSASGLPDTVICPPVYVGKNVTAGKGAHIGPYAVIGEGSRIGAGAEVKNCVIDGASVGKNSKVCGSVICRGAVTGCGTTLDEGSVIGDAAVIGDGCYIMQGVKIWPDRQIAASTTVRSSVMTGSVRGGLSFGAGAVIKGEFNVTLTPEQCIGIGAAAAENGRRVGVSCSGGEAADVAAEALCCGVRSAGGEAVRLDCSFPACAAFTAKALAMDVSIFACQSGESIDLMFFGEGGLPLDRAVQRKIEAAASDETGRMPAEKTGRRSSVSGTAAAYLAAASESVPAVNGMPSVRVCGTGEANRALRRALAGAGCRVEEKGGSLPAFEIVDGGFGLAVFDEDGRRHGQERTLVMTALTEFEHGGGTVAVPYGAPGALDILAASLGTRVLRLGRDGKEAERLYRSQFFLRDGIFAALKLCAAMALSGERLADIAARVPAFFVASRAVSVACGRAKAMRLLANACSETARELCEGLRVDTGRGLVNVHPGHEPGSLIVMGEASREEIAEEICADFAGRAEKLE